MVPYADTIGYRLSDDLTRLCRAPVDVQNLGGIGYFVPARLEERLDEALALKPDAVLLVMAPADIETGMVDDTAAAADAAAGERLGAQARLFRALKQSRAVVVAQHFIFRDMAIYLPLYLRYGDKADFLRPPFTPAWQARLALFDALLTELTRRTSAAGVPLVVAFVPQEAQIALMAGRPLPPGVDPDALPRALAEIAARHGAGFADTSQALRTHPDPERLYYQVDGHLSGEGQPIAAAFIARRFVTGAAPAFASCDAMASARNAP
jgi:uncharacterized membrane protein